MNEEKRLESTEREKKKITHTKECTKHRPARCGIKPLAQVKREIPFI